MSCGGDGGWVDCKTNTGAANIIAAINFVAQVIIIQDKPMRSAPMDLREGVSRCEET